MNKDRVVISTQKRSSRLTFVRLQKEKKEKVRLDNSGNSSPHHEAHEDLVLNELPHVFE